MTAFSYRAVDAAGRKRRGVIEAVNAVGARRMLREQSLVPISVIASNRPDSATAGNGGSPLLDRLRGRAVSSRALSTATRQLSTLIGSDVRIEEALRLVSGQGNGVLEAVLLDVRGSVLEGSSFEQSLGKHARIFPEFYRASIHAGEQSGRLPEVLVYLADFVEARQRSGQKLRLALLYPALLATVSALIMTMMMIYVVPDITRVFVSRGADLPLLTRAVIALSGFLSTYGVALAGVLAVLGFVLRRQFAVPAQRLAFDRLLATRRPFASFTREANGARYAATLATLVQSSVPLLEALTAAAAVIPNRYLRAQADAVAARVREGDSVHRAMANGDAFPAMLVAIVASGEASGRLGPALARAATELDRDVEAKIGVIVSLVEPAVLLLMGGLVLLMVLAILLPIIGLNDLAVS